MNELHVPKWVIAVAGGCAVLGVLLKIADLRSSEKPRRPAESVTKHEREDGASQVGRVDPLASGPAAPGDVPATGEPLVVGRTAPLDPSHFAPRDAQPFLPGSSHAARNRPARERREKRARARRNGGSLEVGEAGSEAVAGLDAAGRGHDGHMAGAGHATPEQPQPPPPAEAAFQSGDDTSYTLNQPIEIPDIGKIVGRSGTMSFWLQPDWQPGNQDDASLLEVGDGQLQVIKNVNFLRFEFTDEAGVKGGIGAPITAWQAGEWHQVTTSWSGNTYSLYLDGQLVSQTNYQGQPIKFAPDSRLLIGSDFPDSRPIAPGVIGRVDVTGRSVAPGEVLLQWQQYAKNLQR